jgi:mannitol-1-/sugar-/sorbitol-6-/2-deoxyglucose-6-phosphatase
MSESVRAVIFDFDGVIMESEPLWRLAFRRVLADRLGLMVSESDLLRLTGLRVPQTIAAILEEASSGRPPRYNGGRLRELAEEVIDEAAKLFEERGEAIPSTIEVIDQLRHLGVPLGIASSSHLRIIHAALRRLGLSGAFRSIQSSYELAQGKPHPDVYEGVAADMQVSPSQCLVVEDSAVGVKSALGAGMTVIGLWRQPSLPPPEFQHCRKVVRELNIEDVLFCAR